MERHAIRSGDVDDEKGGCQTDRGFRDVDMEEDGEDQLDRTQNERRSIEKVEEERYKNGYNKNKADELGWTHSKRQLTLYKSSFVSYAPLCLILHLVHLGYYQPPFWK